MATFDPRAYRQRINDYLYQLMPSEEISAFEKEMQQNADLADEVEFQRLAQVNRYVNLRSKLDEIYEQQELGDRIDEVIEQPHANPIRSIKPKDREPVRHEPRIIPFYQRWQSWAVAATVLILFSLGIWFWPRETGSIRSVEQAKTETAPDLNPTVQEMVATFIEESRQPRTDVPADLQSSVAAYEDKSYDKALNLLNKSRSIERPSKPIENPNQYGASPDGKLLSAKRDDTIEAYRHLYTGLSYLAKKQYEKAIASFDSVATLNSVQEEAQWYKALTYLEAGQTAEAQRMLITIATQNKNRHATEAQTLLDALK